MAQVGRFLADPGHFVLTGVEVLQQAAEGTVGTRRVIPVHGHGHGRKVSRDLRSGVLFIINGRMEAAPADLLHQGGEYSPQDLPFLPGQGGSGPVMIQLGPGADLLSRLAGNAGIGLHQQKGRIKAAALQGLHKGFRGLRQRIALALGGGHKIVPAGQDLPDRADHGGYMLDAVHDLLITVQEDDIGVFAHDFHDQGMAAEVAHFIEMLDLKAQDPLQAGLTDGDDPAVLQMLAQQHAERRRLQGRLSVLFRYIAQGERRVSRHIDPDLAAALFRHGPDGQDQFISVRLRDFVDSAACQQIRKFSGQAGGRDSVKCHRNSFSIDCIRILYPGITWAPDSRKYPRSCKGSAGTHSN